AQPAPVTRVADPRWRGEGTGRAAADRIEQFDEARIQLRTAACRRLTGQVGAGGGDGAECVAQCRDHGMGAHAQGDALVPAGDPERHPGGGRDDPGVRAGPAGQDRVASPRCQRVPVGQADQLGRRGGDRDQPLAHRPLLDREQALDRGPVERITAQAPHRLGRVGDHAAGAQRGDGAGDVRRGGHQPAFFATFFAAFFTAFFAAFFAAAFFAAAFFAVAFLATFFAAFLAATFLAAFLPNRPRAGLPVSSISRVASSRESDEGSTSLGILALSWPLLMYGP